MIKGIKLRLYPNKTQQDQLYRMFGNDRFVWNQMLKMMNSRYYNNKNLPFLGKFKLNYLLKPLKQEYPFLKASDSSSLQLVNECLVQAWKNFFNDKTGGIGKPRFHSRKYSRRREQANRLCLQDKNRKVLYPRNLDSFKNWQKAQKMKARYQAKVANKRHDYLQKLTTHLVRQYDVIVIEDLRTKNLLKNHHLAKSISNASWSLFRQMLEYKCKWYGKKLIAVDPKNTSRICSNCGYNSDPKPLNIREWTCPKCHVHHDRDINATVNILNRAVKTV